MVEYKNEKATLASFLFGLLLFIMFCTVVYRLGRIRDFNEKQMLILAQIRDRVPEEEESEY